MHRPSRIFAALAICALATTACGGGGGSVPSGGSTPTPPPSSSLACPTSGSLPSSVALGAPALQDDRRPARPAAGAAQYVPGTLVVSYSGKSTRAAIDRSAALFSAHAGPDLELDRSGAGARVLSVDPLDVDRAIARLRGTPGVARVERAQYRRRMSAVTPDDPYYLGFGPGAPYFENATSPGQWDMYAMNLGTAWGDFPSLPVQGAPIAIIDTGVDVTHPDLTGGKIIRAECFVTYPSGSSQSSGPYVTDSDGHGTNVAGIADADTNNSFGFAGVAYDAPMLAYRIFPTDPSGGCQNSTIPQCSTTDVDEVSAINDALANGAKVINLSLGASGPLATCTDSIEENAIENAISQGVVVVAAAGNDGTNYLGCPAAYPGVIAAGASGLDDSGSTIKEVVAGYSDYTSSGLQSGGGAYLVAPGGTATSSSDPDQLHWIGNITSSQQSGASQFCGTDLAGETGDCQSLFTGTSQATPHVAGVVSLMLGITPTLTPAQIASDLCSTADKIGDPRQGCGRVDAAGAVTLAASQ